MILQNDNEIYQKMLKKTDRTLYRRQVADLLARTQQMGFTPSEISMKSGEVGLGTAIAVSNISRMISTRSIPSLTNARKLDRTISALRCDVLNGWSKTVANGGATTRFTLQDPDEPGTKTAHVMFSLTSPDLDKDDLRDLIDLQWQVVVQSSVHLREMIIRNHAAGRTSYPLHDSVKTRHAGDDPSVPWKENQVELNLHLDVFTADSVQFSDETPDELRAVLTETALEVSRILTRHYKAAAKPTVKTDGN